MHPLSRAGRDTSCPHAKLEPQQTGTLNDEIREVLPSSHMRAAGKPFRGWAPAKRLPSSTHVTARQNFPYFIIEGSSLLGFQFRMWARGIPPCSRQGVHSFSAAGWRARRPGHQPNIELVKLLRVNIELNICQPQIRRNLGCGIPEDRLAVAGSMTHVDIHVELLLTGNDGGIN